MLSCVVCTGELPGESGGSHQTAPTQSTTFKQPSQYPELHLNRNSLESTPELNPVQEFSSSLIVGPSCEGPNHRLNGACDPRRWVCRGPGTAFIIRSFTSIYNSRWLLHLLCFFLIFDLKSPLLQLSILNTSTHLTSNMSLKHGTYTLPHPQNLAERASNSPLLSRVIANRIDL